MKIIFLDVDGVMTSARTGWFNWDIYAISFLKWICEQSDAKIVISSTWRYNRDKSFFDPIFPNLIHDDWRTPASLMDFDINCRGDEIKVWLDNHPEIETYLIIDDDSDMLDDQLQHLIHTDTLNGLMFKQMIEISDRWCGMNKVYNGNLHALELHPNMFSKPSPNTINNKIKFI